MRPGISIARVSDCGLGRSVMTGVSRQPKPLPILATAGCPASVNFNLCGRPKFASPISGRRPVRGLARLVVVLREHIEKGLNRGVFQDQHLDPLLAFRGHNRVQRPGLNKHLTARSATFFAATLCCSAHSSRPEQGAGPLSDDIVAKALKRMQLSIQEWRIGGALASQKSFKNCVAVGIQMGHNVVPHRALR